MSFKPIHSILGLLLSSFLFCNDALATVVEEEAIEQTKTIEYWEKDAYSTYATDTFRYSPDLAQEKFSTLSKKYTGEAFNYEENKIGNLSILDRIGRWIEDFFHSLFPNWGANAGKTAMYILIGVGIVAILYTFYKLFLGRNRVFIRETQDQEDSEIQFVEKNLEQIDISHYIQQAITEENWAKAIRYLHLQNLQLLNRKGWIEWDYRKTNQDFLIEIEDEKVKEAFQKTTLLFNYIWFGDFTINQVQFEEFQQDFIHFKNSLA